MVRRRQTKSVAVAGTTENGEGSHGLGSHGLGSHGADDPAEKQQCVLTQLREEGQATPLTP